MSRNEASNRFSLARNTARGVKPLANSSATAVKRSMIRTRAWAAPQVDHAGHFFQDSAAPKISAMFFSTARRLAPNRTRASRWRKVAGASAVGAAASVAAATARSRSKQDSKPAPDEADA